MLVAWLGICRPLGIVVPELQRDEGLVLAGEALGTQSPLVPFLNRRMLKERDAAQTWCKC